MSRLLPHPQMNVLVDKDGFFAATNDPNPVRWIKRADGSYVVDPKWEATDLASEHKTSQSASPTEAKEGEMGV